jgi:hypothetical protein
VLLHSVAMEGIKAIDSVRYVLVLVLVLTTAQALSEWIVWMERESLGKDEPPNALNT